MSLTDSKLWFALWTVLAAASVIAAAPPITLQVDARDVTRGIQHAHLTLPVRPGPLTLAYPKWIPGEHAANGPLTQVVGLVITGSGKALPWRRDPLDPFLFRVEVPRGAQTLDVRFDYLSPPKAFADGYGRTPNVTPHLLILPLNHLVLYPYDAAADAVPIRAEVHLPAGWKFDQNGLEHHESTDIRDNEALFTDPARLFEHRTVPHEYVHSWNGKYRRPVGLATRNYQQPMVDDLLWVYEGMTRYLGDLVLRTRSGLSPPEQARAYLAWVAATMDGARPGRAWRSLADTATALPGYRDAPAEWSPIRRRRDYYDEMMLV